MRKVAALGISALLLLACRVAGGDWDCRTTLMACARQFHSSEQDERCMALFELEMCVHGMHANPNCHTYEARGHHRLSSIIDRYSYCKSSLHRMRTHDSSYGPRYNFNSASRASHSVLAFLPLLGVVLNWTA